MEVEEFPDDPYFTPEIQAEVEDIIQRIACGSGEGSWAEPDRVKIIRKLAGGKSGAVVLEARVETGARNSLKVIKIGPRFDLRNEFASFKSIRDHITAQFVPLQAVTEGLLSDAGKPKEKQAVVYDHAARFVGNVEVVTFEAIAAHALRSDATIQHAETVLAELFKGIRSALYNARNIDSEPTSLRARWNFRLGFDAVVSVRQILGEERRLTIGEDRSSLLPVLAESRALEIREPAERKAEFVELSRGTVEWWELDDADHILAVQLENPHFIRYHVKSGIEGKSLRYLDRDDQIRDGQEWALLGEIEDWRNERHKALFLSELGSDFQIADGKLTGPDALVVADPFPLLANVLDQKRPNRITSWAHGDLNARNILVAENRPCLIDYAFTREGEPLMFDFVRLEGTLAAEILPGDLTWAQHVRLQRFLALACRLAGPTASEQHLDRIAQELAGRLAVEKIELGRAFRLFWAVRKAARDVTPPEYREDWARDYVEQLFLFGHQMLKWFHKTEMRSATAVAAILGVTAETLQPARVYHFWNNDELAESAPLFLQLMELQAEFLLADLASLGRALPQKLIDSAPFCAARQKLVRSRFQKRARDIKENLTSQHNVFIRLRAFIELKGQLREAGKRVAGGIELGDMLESDTQLAERERLRTKEGEKGEDALTLVTEHAPVVLLGDAGAGKSTVAREWEYRLAKTIVDADPGNEARLPIVIPASRIAGELGDWDPEKPRNLTKHLKGHVTDFPAHLSLAQLFEAGAACLVIDALNEVGDKRQAVALWAEAFYKTFPLTPLIVCHRQYNYPAGLLPFHVVTLQKVEANQARRYIRESLSPTEKEEDSDGLAEELIRLLLDDPNQGAGPRSGANPAVPLDGGRIRRAAKVTMRVSRES